jgi:hypothetical protein
MVKIGSGGASFAGYVNGEWYSDHDFILSRLPLAMARSYQQNFWALKYQKRCERIGTTRVSPLEKII